MDLAALRALPKAELHQHLDGAVRPSTAIDLAAETGMTLGLEEARARLVAPPRCRDQAELLRYFDLPVALLQTASALRRVAGELVEELTADGVTYAELRWAPRLHLAGGLGVGDVIEAVAEGLEAATGRIGPRAPQVALIVTAMRQHPPGANVELARTAGRFGAPVVGFDLAGPEALWPAAPHAAAFRAAEQAGLATTCHAGESPGSDRVREAIDLGVRRIGHGVTVAQDPELIDLVRMHDITLDLCPTSNVQAGIVPELTSHPLGALHRAGVSVTISTDDRTVSNTTLTEEMARTAVALGLTRQDLAVIALNAFRRGFAPAMALASLRAAAASAWRAWAGLDDEPAAARSAVIG
jgi:adenosine deaminase